MTSDTTASNDPKTEAGSVLADISEHIREAFDHAKEAAYNALTEVGQDAENEAELAEKAVVTFLENLAGKTGTEVGKAAEFLLAELRKVL